MRSFARVGAPGDLEDPHLISHGHRLDR
ncbi:hypothetical protein MICRO8M_60020 [Microbacterium sp. 8M]|nr:hypothetical protein MICRO8M_60020 [Microbacterium sp. 8M]